MTKRYDNGDGVEHINLKIYEGEIVTMLGPSGCGKSTILRTIGGFLDVTDGDILIDNESIVKLPPEKRPTAMVFQSSNLWTHMTVYENLAFGLKLRKIPKDQIRADIDKHLKLVSMSGFEKKYPTQLSGGQQQRIAIARSLLLKPSVLLLDEPFSALDAKIRQQMREELKKIQAELGITVVFVTHDQEEAMALSHRIVVMNKGKFEQVGTPTEIYDNPATKRTERPLPSVPRMSPSPVSLRISRAACGPSWFWDITWRSTSSAETSLSNVSWTAISLNVSTPETP